jgi:hypothetical protein
MTTPQDPNHPGAAPVPGPSVPQPAPPLPPQPAPQQPPPPQPAPQQPPAAYPGYQPAPGYQVPPAYGPGGYLGRPNEGSPQAWESEEPPRRSGFLRRHGCLLSMVGFLALMLVIVVGCVVVLTPALTMDLKLVNDLGPRAQQVTFDIQKGHTVWTIHMARGYESQAVDVACHIVRPDLAGTQFATDSFVLVDVNGNRLADETTPCA